MHIIYYCQTRIGSELIAGHVVLKLERFMFTRQRMGPKCSLLRSDFALLPHSACLLQHLALHETQREGSIFTTERLDTCTP